MIRSFKKLERLGSNFDWFLVAIIAAICAVGLAVIYSAGFDPDTGESLAMRRQAYSMLIGAGAFLVGFLFSTTFWRRYSWFIYGACVFLLIAIFAEGLVAKGARRWLDLGFIRMQPAEFMKIGIILGLAKLLATDAISGYDLKTLIKPALVVLIPAGLTLVQPDLGTALCQIAVGGAMIYLAGVKGRTILTLALGAVAAAIPAWNLLHDYQKKRVLNFLSPEADPLASGYHAIQSKIAVGSGALTGKGFLKGTQTQLRFLPEQTTDFIFSVLAEEWGFLGTATVIVLYFLLLYRILRISSRASDQFGAFVAFGIAALFFFQIVVNIGMVTGSLPVVGITLPLLSYGGSSVMTLLFGTGLVAGIHSRRYLFT
jgi:rod shape determining protein RodA